VRCSFVHFGDVHLGTQQYDSPERLNDFGRAWLFACEYIARERPDFAICTGDLFNRFTINPLTFDQALAGLRLVREADVPIVDIQGNHDRARYGESRTWLHTLADQGLLTYLDIGIDGGGIDLRRVGPGAHLGSFVEWSGCRITGARYLGASTERVLEGLAPELAALPRDGAFNILVLHAGLEGIIPNFNAELTVDAVERLRGQVDYVALGHIHKHYAIGNFVYNGGSLETWALNEWSWPRGLLHVEIDTTRANPITYRLIDVPRRPFCLMRVDVDDFSSPNALLHACLERLQRERARQTDERPVAILSLTGHLRFDQIDLPVNQLEEACRKILDPLVALVREQFDAREFTNEGGDESDEAIDRPALERSIIQARLAADDRYAARAPVLARVAIELKDHALHDAPGDELLGVFRRGISADVVAAPDVLEEPVAVGEEAHP
jgi:exonuclease SbcD